MEEADRILSSALEKQRATIRSLRDLSFELEPVVLRDQGFEPAVRALADQLGMSNRIQIDLDVEAAGARFPSTPRSRIFQIIREALHQAIRRGPPDRVVGRGRRGRGRRRRGRDLGRRPRRAPARELRRDRGAGALAERPHDGRPWSRRRHRRPHRASRRIVSVARLGAHGRRPDILPFVSKPTGYELVIAKASRLRSASIVEVEDEGRWIVNRGQRLAAPAGPAAVRLPSADRLAERLLGRDSAEDERCGEAARVAARRDSADVRPRREEAIGTDNGAPPSIRRPPSVCVTSPGRTPEAA